MNMDTEQQVRVTSTVPRLFEEQVKRTPSNRAVVFEEESLTYAELNQRANQLARHLQQIGVGREQLVGVCVERSLELVVAMIGVIKAGAVYVPLDPRYPAERLAYMMQDAGISVLLTQEHLVANLPDTPQDASVICLDSEWEWIAEQSVENGSLEIDEEQLAYVIYTSGSTGLPKGVLLEHRGLANMIQETIELYDVRAEGKLLQFASFGFDASINEMFTALLAGATLVMARQEDLMPGPALIRLLQEQMITNVTLPPSVLAMLPAEQFPHLRSVVSAGEACSADLVARWAPGRRFLNAYGPTEATVCTTVALCTDGNQRPSIGKPIANMQVYVLDEAMQPVATGQAGELYIGGIGVARGYLNRPDLTRERFVPSPFVAGARLYRTGDLVRLLPDGELDYLGRLDDQVKIRGYRIELGEIEERLRDHGAVRDSVVMVREDVQGAKRLVAYLVQASGAAGVTGSELRRFLQAKLPEYMVPVDYLWLEQFPLTVNGKVDRRALPAPDGKRLHLDVAYVAPQNEREAALAHIFSEVLGLSDIGVNDPFLELGGHSLAAIQVLARVRERFGVELSLKDLFVSSTVAGLARCVEERLLSGRAGSSVSIASGSRDGDQPLSFSQERVWFVHQVSAEHMAYSSQAVVRFTGALDVELLQRCLTEMVARHEIFRTVFTEVDGRPVQRVQAPFAVELPLISLQDVAPEEREGHLERLMEADMLRPFDMTCLPLVRWTLYQVGVMDYVLLHVEQHMVHDGWSYNIFLREMFALYRAYAAGQPSPLSPMPVQFADFARFQREWMAGEQGQRQLSYWKEQLAGSPAMLELPTDRSRLAVPSHCGASLRIELPESLCHDLSEWSREEGVTMFVTLLTAFNVLLYRYTGQEDILIGSGAAARSWRDTEGLIGMIVNNVVLRTQLTGELSFRELVERVQEMALEAFAHQDVPFDQVVEAVNPTRDLSRNPLYQVMFSFHDTPLPDLELPGVAVKIKEALSNGSAKFDLNVVGIPPAASRLDENGEPVGFTLLWEYSTDLFEEATIARMIEHYLTLLEGIVEDADRALHELPLLTGVERERILQEWNETDTDVETDLCIHQLFEATVLQHPDLAAVIDAGECMTYLELNRRANQLARKLQDFGAGPDVIVGICAERSSELIVAVLAVLKAGAAYVPIDPAYPQQRVAFIVEDAGLSVVLTKQHLLPLVAGPDVAVILLDQEQEPTSESHDEPVPCLATSDNLAYMIYTSGSSGVPKGVAVSHRALVNFAKWIAGAYPMQAGERGTLIAGAAFDASLMELWLWLTSGVTMLIPSEEVRLQPNLLMKYLLEHQVAGCFLPTPLANRLVQEQLPDGLALKYLFAGGDKLQAVRQGLPFALVDLYGPTECTVVTTHASLHTPTREGATLTIGRPIANARVYVLDRFRQPVPAMVPGELHIGGAGLARGYWRREELSAEKFILHSFDGESQTRLYKTGDSVRWLPDGQLEFLGRIDNQVKVRGFRIELSEIEQVLREHPVVQAVAVIAQDGIAGEKRLAAYLVGTSVSDQQPSVESLRQFLKAKLPEYMIPASFQWLTTIPLTPNGKVDTKSLPVISPERPDGAGAYAAPQSSVERILAEIWQRMLGVEPVGIYENYFALGGDSILSLQIIAQAKGQGVRFTTKQLFEHQTIAELALACERIEEGVVEANEQGLVTGTVLFTPIQQWWLEQAVCDLHHWNQSRMLVVERTVSGELIEQALTQLMQHHDMLRLRLEQVGEVWQSYLSAEAGLLPYERVDLSHLSEAARAALMEEMATEVQVSLHLTNGPLWRAVFFDAGAEGAGRLLLVIHHLVVDGVSWRILLDDLETMCRQIKRGEEPQLPAKTTSFQRFAEKLTAYAQDLDGISDESGYWERLCDERVLPLPLDVVGGANTWGSMRKVTLGMNGEETRALLQDVYTAYRTPLQDVLLTALLRTMSNWTGSQTLLVHLEGHGREDILEGVDLSRTVGWFTSMYPALLTLTDGSISTSLKSVKEQVRSIPNRGIGYGVLRYLSGDLATVERLQQAPRPEISFNYLGQFDPETAEKGWLVEAPESCGPNQSLRGQRQHLLDLTAKVVRGELQITWMYGTEFHHAATIEKLARDLMQELRAFVSHCHSSQAFGYTPSDFPLATCSQPELDNLLGNLPRVENLYPLSPLQQGLLFHALYTADAGDYVTQLVFDLTGDVDVPLLTEAWRLVVERHPVLRTSFLWQEIGEPHQVVHRASTIELGQEDWRDVPPEEQEARWQERLASDRRLGIDLSEPPLMRWLLVRQGDDAYRLLWTHHHILLDGWSLPILFQELFSSYEALATGNAVQPHAVLPYANYIRWLQEQDPSEAERFWRQYLSGVNGPTTLSIGRSQEVGTESVASYGQEVWWLSAETTAKLQRMARQNQLTMNALMQGMWALLLHRYSGERDVVFGTTVSGRNADLPGIDTMVGLLINTLPVRVRVEPEQSLRTWLAHLQTEQVRMRQFEHNSLVEIQGWSEMPRGSMMFDTLFVYENYPMDSTRGRQVGDLRIAGITGVEQTHYGLTVACFPGERLRFRLTYDQHRFSDVEIERLSGGMRLVLEAMADSLHTNIGTLPMLTAEEQSQLDKWKGTRTEYPRESHIGQLFEEQVASTPDRVAVVVGDEQWTYLELNRLANRLAHRLIERGVQPGMPVGICIERSWQMIVGLLGIVKAGGAYVPLDRALPSARLAQIVSDSNLSLVLTRDCHLEMLEAETDQVMCLDAELEQTASEREHNPHLPISADGLVYVMYTSGSTGKPKGVCVPHRAVVRLVKGTDYVDFSESDVFLQLAPISFDAATFEIWGSLLNGAQLVLFPSEQPTLAELGEVIREHKVSTLWLTAGLFHQMVEHQLADLASVRQLLAGGDVLSRAAVKKVLEACPGIKLINGYGPTENTTFTCCYTMTDPSQVGASVSIGKPIANTEVYVLGDDLQPVPIGVAGELWIGGDGLAQGYLHQPELTAERFVPHPFVDQVGAILYRTGDRVRYLPDGNLEFLGRIDHQVKLRGFRIELGEIESVLLQHSDISEAVVRVREMQSGDKRLIAYVVPSTKQQGETAILRKGELREFLKERLPDYMVPSSVILLEAMPLTRNGKVDVSALPMPDAGELEQSVYVLPRNPLEELTAGLFAEVLGVERVGSEDNFFELGGHSLVATQLISRVQGLFGVQVPLRCLFDHPTVRRFTRQVEQKQREGVTGENTAPPFVSIARDGDRDLEVKLSSAQQRLWFLDRFLPGNPVYNMPVALRMRGTLDTLGLKNSVQVLVERHEALRTVFAQWEEEAVQVILPSLEVPFAYYDLRDQSGEAQEEQVRRLTLELAEQRFDLTQGPLFRVALLQVSETEHVLMFLMHHIVSDGWSMNLLTKELASLYEAWLTGESNPLPEITHQYADYALWQDQWLQEDVLATQLQYWKQQLGGTLPLLQLPTDHPRPALQTYNGASCRFTIPRDLAAELRGLSRGTGVTMYMTLLAAYQTLLYRYTGQEDLIVGSMVAGRNLVELESIVGFFVNALVLRTDLSGNPTFALLLQRVREVALEAYAHQDVPFEKLVEELQPERDRSRTPLFQTAFQLVAAPALSWAGLEVSLFELATNTTQFDLTVSLVEEADGTLHGRFDYNTDLFEGTTISRMINHYLTLLASVAENPAQSIAELRLLPEAERNHLLTEWNQQESDCEQDLCVHRMFERQAEQTPDGIALVYMQEQVTYLELNGRANQLAHYLQKFGVGEGTMVGICLDRSLTYVVSVLAVLKTGAAYVPFDPAYPSERLAYMLQDSGVTVLLTEQQINQSLQGHRAQVIDLDQAKIDIFREPTSNLICTAQPDSVAYLMYTSGSTGRPKGVLIPHRGIVRLAKGLTSLELSPQETVLHVAPISFDGSTLEVWGGLLNGARVVVFPTHLPTLEELGAFLRQEGITTALLTTGLFQQMVEECVEDLRGLRQLVVGGDVLSVTHASRVLQSLPHLKLINVYGPTENTTVTTAYALTAQTEIGHTVPIGKPIAGTEVYVLDRNQNPVPVGVPGELYTGGDGLALGYWQQPERTASAFVKHPFRRSNEATLYRTGDLVRWLPSGDLEFLGRTDDQVKIRGFRIEPGEVENVLGQHPDLSETCVVALPDPSGNKRLVAYLVFKAGCADEIERVRHHAKANLPAYLLPSVYVRVERLPLTANGKVDRKLLPQPEALQMSTEEYVASRNVWEAGMVSIWQELFGLSRVGVLDDFFELGGSSLLAMKMIAKCRNKLNIDLPLHQLFETPTIAELVAWVQRQASSPEQAIAVKPPIVRKNEDLPVFPLSYEQEELWRVEQTQPVDPVYNTTFALHLSGSLQVAALADSMAAIAARHELLRARVEQRQEGPMMVIEPEWTGRLSQVDLTDLAPWQQASRVEQHSLTFARQPFLFEKEPLFRAQLLCLAPKEHVLLVSMHHLITDAWSTAVFLRELAALYRSELYRSQISGDTTLLAPVPVRFADYVRWQRDWLQGETLQRLLSYWKQQLAMAPTQLQLPGDLPRPAQRTYRGAEQGLHLPSDLCGELKTLANCQDATMFMVLLSAFNLTLYSYSGQQDMLVGTPIATRSGETERVIGYFLNTLILRTDLSGDPTFAELLQRVRSTVRGALAHQDLPVERLKSELFIEQEAGRNSLYQAAIVYYDLPEAAVDWEGLQVRADLVSNGTSELEIMFVLRERNGEVNGVIEYNRDCFSHEVMEEMAGRFVHLLRAAVSHPEQRLSLLLKGTVPNM